MISAIWALAALAGMVLLLLAGQALHHAYRSLPDGEVYERVRAGEPQASVTDGLPEAEADGAGPLTVRRPIRPVPTRAASTVRVRRSTVGVRRPTRPHTGCASRTRTSHDDGGGLGR